MSASDSLSDHVDRAHALGLRRVTERTFVCERHGVTVWATANGGYHARGIGDLVGEASMTRVEALFKSRLDLGLDYRSSARFAPGPLGAVYLPPAILGAPRSVGDEASRVDAMMAHAWQDLLPGTWSRTQVAIDDRGVLIAEAGWRFDLATEDAIERAARIVVKAHEARLRVRPAHALVAHAKMWMALAHRHGLAMSTCPLAVWGNVDDVAIDARVERPGPFDIVPLFARSNMVGPSYAVVFTASPQEPLPLGLDVTRALPADTEAYAWAFHQPARVDPGFDGVFRVRTSEPDVARAVLAPVAEDLLSFARQGDVRVSHEGITFRPLELAPPDAASKILPTLAAMVRTMRDAVPTRRGIYR